MGPLFQFKAETSRFIIHLELYLKYRCFRPQALLVGAAGLILYYCPQMMTHRRALPGFRWCAFAVGVATIWNVLKQPIKPCQPVGRVTTLDQRAEYLTGLRVQQFSHGTISSEEECFLLRASLWIPHWQKGNFRAEIFFYKVDIIMVRGWLPIIFLQLTLCL